MGFNSGFKGLINFGYLINFYLYAVERPCWGLLLFFIPLPAFVYYPVCNTVFECKTVEDLFLIFSL